MIISGARGWEHALPFVRSNAVDLCYETFGDPADPVMLLIMGLGEQMIAWAALAAAPILLIVGSLLPGI